MNEMIKQGFVQYLSLASDDSSLQGNNALQKGIGDLCEICLEISVDKDKHERNLFILKPIFRATIFLLEERLSQIKAIKNVDTYTQVKQYEKNIQFLQNLVDNIKEEVNHE